jgi:hypothetical protein
MPTKVYVAQETPTTFKASGGTVLFTPTSLANGAGRISTQWDRGSSSRPAAFLARARYKCATAPAVGNLLEVYLAMGDGTYIDGNLSAVDAAVAAADKRRNLRWIMNVVADTASTSEIMVAERMIWLPSRYVSVVWWNALGVALSSTAADMEFTLTPVPDEVQ